jgi:hypothetical protein
MDSKSNCVVLNTKQLTAEKIDNIIRWCNQHFGLGRYDFIPDFPGYHWRFYLPDAESEILFRLRWAD